MNREELTKLLMEAYERGQSDLIKSCQETVSIAIDTAILAEREACAEVGKYALPNHSDLGLLVEAAIRARGQA